MAKVGTAHIEIKPMLNEEALSAIEQRISEAVTKGVREGMAQAFSAREVESVIHIEGWPADVTFPLSADNPIA